MTTHEYRQLIIEGIDGLPPDLLAEITDFVYFVRKRATRPKAYRDDLRATLLDKELAILNQQELAHLEQEFAGYEQRYPIN